MPDPRIQENDETIVPSVKAATGGASITNPPRSANHEDDLDYKDQGRDDLHQVLMRAVQNDEDNDVDDLDYKDQGRDDLHQVMMTAMQPPSFNSTNDLPSDLEYKELARTYVGGDGGVDIHHHHQMRSSAAHGVPPTPTMPQRRGGRHMPDDGATTSAIIVDYDADDNLEYKDLGRTYVGVVATPGVTAARPAMRGQQAMNELSNVFDAEDEAPVPPGMLSEERPAGGEPQETRNKKETAITQRPRRRFYWILGTGIVISVLTVMALVVFFATTARTASNNDEATTTEPPTEELPAAFPPTSPPRFASTTAPTAALPLTDNNSSASPEPRWVEVGTGIGGNGTGGQFGWTLSMSGSGQTIIIGAPRGEYASVWQQRRLVENNDNNSTTTSSSSIEQVVWDLQARFASENGDVNNDFAWRVAMNQLGNIAAIGCTSCEHPELGPRVGLVRVFEYNSIAQQWQPLGLQEDLVGTAPLEGFGYGVDLNADGNLLAVGMFTIIGDDNQVGRVRVFQYDRLSNRWSAVGQTLNGTVPDGRFGCAVRLSSQGTILAVGSYPFSTPGFVRVYRFDATERLWLSMGQELTSGVNELDYFGYKLGLSADGQILAVGTFFDPDSPHRGFVQVYRYNATSELWIERGQRLFGSPGENYGLTVDIAAADGNIMVVGASRNSNAGFRAGRVQVYRFFRNDDDDTTAAAAEEWRPLGPPIDGLGPGHGFGADAVLSDDGTFLAVGALYSSTHGYRAGAVRFFEYITEESSIE